MKCADGCQLSLHTLLPSTRPSIHPPSFLPSFLVLVTASPVSRLCAVPMLNALISPVHLLVLVTVATKRCGTVKTSSKQPWLPLMTRAHALSMRYDNCASSFGLYPFCNLRVPSLVYETCANPCPACPTCQLMSFFPNGCSNKTTLDHGTPFSLLPLKVLLNARPGKFAAMK